MCIEVIIHGSTPSLFQGVMAEINTLKNKLKCLSKKNIKMSFLKKIKGSKKIKIKSLEWLPL